jgi:hypothetical protein
MTNTDSLKGFWALIATQFQGAFKHGLQDAADAGCDAHAANGSREYTCLKINALFIIPSCCSP